MPAKRLRRKKPRSKPWILQEPDAPEDHPLMLTCPGCGARVPNTAHSCPHCDTLFYERRPAKGRRIRTTPPRPDDPDIDEFAQRMDEIEKWTRVICTIAGVIFALAAVWYIRYAGFGLYGFCGLAFLVIVSVVCLLRGLGGRDADINFLSSLPGFRNFRL